MESNLNKRAEINELINSALLRGGDYSIRWVLGQQNGTFYTSLRRSIKRTSINEGLMETALSRLAVAEGFPGYITSSSKDFALSHIASAGINFGRSSSKTDNRKAIKHLLVLRIPP